MVAEGPLGLFYERLPVLGTYVLPKESGSWISYLIFGLDV